MVLLLVNRLRETAQLGITTLSKTFNLTSLWDDFVGPDTVLEPNFNIERMDSEVKNDSVTFSYSLRERQQFKVIQSNNIIHSSASCNLIFINGNGTYDGNGSLIETVGTCGTGFLCLRQV